MGPQFTHSGGVRESRNISETKRRLKRLTPIPQSVLRRILDDRQKEKSSLTDLSRHYGYSIKIIETCHLKSKKGKFTIGRGVRTDSFLALPLARWFSGTNARLAQRENPNGSLGRGANSPRSDLIIHDS